MTDAHQDPPDDDLDEQVELALIDLVEGYAAARYLRDAAPDDSPLKTENLEAIRVALIEVARRRGVLPAERRGGFEDHDDE